MKDVSILQTVYSRLRLTAVFQGTLTSPLIRAFFRFMETPAKSDKLSAYAAFVSEIYEGGGSLTDVCRRMVFEDENVYVKAYAKGVPVDENVERAAERELETFSLFASLTHEVFASELDEPIDTLPLYRVEKADFVKEYKLRLKEIEKYGYGIFSSSAMFRLSNGGQLERIISADEVCMDGFIGYEAERGKVEENTLALLEGGPSANTLLCGDAGTGKSSTVKAIVNRYFDRGLRLIELRKDQLGALPYVMGKVRGNPLKFIIFIDDLSFQKSDDNFSMLKAALEGSAAARADNAVIYATSNRRHIVKENFGDREGGDVHRNDTLQETLSLSERFGLVVYYQKPDKKLYLEIVNRLAERYSLKIGKEELEIKAEAFALKKGNRSARCAEQFIDSLRRLAK